jgi:hypothetical protein
MECQCMCYVVVVVFTSITHYNTRHVGSSGKASDCHGGSCPGRTNRTDCFAILLSPSFYANTKIVPQTRQWSVPSISLPVHVDIVDLNIRSCKI